MLVFRLTVGDFRSNLVVCSESCSAVSFDGHRKRLSATGGAVTYPAGACLLDAIDRALAAVVQVAASVDDLAELAFEGGGAVHWQSFDRGRPLIYGVLFLDLAEIELWRAATSLQAIWRQRHQLLTSPGRLGLTLGDLGDLGARNVRAASLHAHEQLALGGATS